jgi:uncharacterized RDD family membrane protein YckC
MPTKPTRVVGRRVVAFLIDGILFYAFAAAVFFAMADKDTDIARDLLTGKLSANENTYINVDLGDHQYSIVGSGKFFLYLLITFGVSFLYYVVLQGRTGWTLGKLALGIRTVAADGRPAGIGKAALRWVMWIADGFAFYLVAFVTAMATEWNQRVGDLVAKTYVVRRSAFGQPLPIGQPALGFAPQVGPQRADWYPDPSGQARLRYWDGQQWTEHTSA